MSVLGALDAGVSGMDAQAAALSAISNNVANSQTVGYKETDTSFVDYVTQSTATSQAPGSVVALPQYMNSLAGTPTQVSNPTSLAVSGAGFFPVQLPVGTTGAGAATFSPEQYYTQAGDFSLNNAGYLQNSEGYVLDGFPAANAAGTAFNTNTLQPIQVSEAPSPPVATSTVSVSGNLGATPPAGTTSYSSTVQIYDPAGNQQNLSLNWSQVTAAGPVSATNPITAANPAIPNEWALTATSGASTTGPMIVTFGSTPATAGTITGITGPAGTVPTAQASGDAATVNLTLPFGTGTQNIALNLGQFGSTNGITQFAGTTYAQSSAPVQNGSPQGNYAGVTVQSSGAVVINYTNGATQTIAQVPLANFADPNALQQQSGQAFTATTASGVANVVTAGTGGTGTLVAGSVEGSNVDIATQFTQMIVAQQAYTANSKVITTANSMLQVAVNMIQG
ncbi:MAG TPA: flagellar hook-basal body complex protein [Rhodopila sp.]|nr:flagellar hook-basal body complex protein [Rhodopila sp.]